MELKSVVGRCRVTMDESYEAETAEGKTKEKWRYQEVKGRNGTVYPYSKDQLAVTFTTTSNEVSNRCKKKEWKLIQDGDTEKTFLFPLSDLKSVLEAIGPRKVRVLSPEHREIAKRTLAKFHYKPKGHAVQKHHTA